MLSRDSYELLKTVISPSQSLIEEAQALCLDLFPGGHYLLIPSFFELMDVLDSRGIDFRVVFRTFGHDLPVVCRSYSMRFWIIERNEYLIHVFAYREFNLMCEGKHPLMKGRRMDGTNGSVDRRIRLPHHTGSIYRSGEGINDVLLSHVSSSEVF